MRLLSTECPPLDELLDGGLESDAITLVFGEGGSGKTNLALQCARAATRGGHRVAYIDTEGVSGRRLEQVFVSAEEGADERLLFFTPFTIQEQERMVRNATVAPDLGLLVVDSINMHYRLHIDDEASEREAARSLYKQLHQMTTFARQKQVPVLITGQVYGGEDATQPFARRTMEHLVKALVRFEKRPDGSRRATVLKHRSVEEGRSALFSIGPQGLTEWSGQAPAAKMM
jgi:DNA repair protein RadB